MTKMKSNKFHGWVVTSFILAATLAFLMMTSGSPALAEDEYLYGASNHMTGPIPQYGEWSVRAHTMAFEDLAKTGWINGKKIKFISEDDKNDPKLALAAVNKLINVDKVPIFESSGSSVVLAVGPVAQKSKVVFMNVAAQNPNIRKLGDFCFSLVPLADRVMAATADWAYDGQKAKTAVMLHINNEYGKGVADEFKKLFEAKGGKVLATEIVNQGETDFTTSLTKLKFVKADIIFFVGHENELGYALKKAKEMGMTTPWFCAPGVYNPMTLQIAGDAANGLQSADYPFDPVDGTDRMKEFGQRYKEKFGVLPGNAPARTYDAIMLYADALKKGATTPEKIRDFLFSVKNYDGVSGPVTFDKDGITLEQPVIRGVKDGKLVLIKK